MNLWMTGSIMSSTWWSVRMVWVCCFPDVLTAGSWIFWKNSINGTGKILTTLSAVFIPWIIPAAIQRKRSMTLSLPLMNWKSGIRSSLPVTAQALNHMKKWDPSWTDSWIIFIAVNSWYLQSRKKAAVIETYIIQDPGGWWTCSVCRLKMIADYMLPAG